MLILFFSFKTFGRFGNVRKTLSCPCLNGGKRGGKRLKELLSNWKFSVSRFPLPISHSPFPIPHFTVTSVTYSHEAIVLVATAVKTLICLIKLTKIKPNKWPNNKQQKRAQKTEVRLNNKTAESAENMTAMKRNQNIYNDVSSPLILRSRFGCPRIARVTSSEELDTMSKNNLRGITLVRGPIWGIHSLT